MAVRLVLFGKRRCSLCDEAREAVDDVLADVEDEVPVTLEEVDITQDEALFARYRHDVPVLALDGEELFRHRVDVAELRRRLRAARVV